MIHGIFGANTYAARAAIRLLTKDFDEVEHYDGSEIEASQLPEILLGATLFSSGKKAVVIRGAGDKTDVWKALEEWLPKVDDDTLVLLVDTTPDKRTKTYKWLQKNAQITACELWKGRDTGVALAWAKKYCEAKKYSLSPQVITELIARSTRENEQDAKPIIDQEQLANAIDQLAVVDGDISEEIINAVLPPSVYDNVFDLLATALNGQEAKLRTSIANLRMNKEGHQIFALLASQVVNVYALKLGLDEGVAGAEIAKDLGVHPFVLSQLERFAKAYSREDLARIVEAFAKADGLIKSTATDPWTYIEIALTDIAIRAKKK